MRSLLSRVSSGAPHSHFRHMSTEVKTEQASRFLWGQVSPKKHSYMHIFYMYIYIYIICYDIICYVTGARHVWRSQSLVCDSLKLESCFRCRRFGVDCGNQAPGTDVPHQGLQFIEGAVLTYSSQTQAQQQELTFQKLHAMAWPFEGKDQVAVGHAVYPGSTIIFNPASAPSAPGCCWRLWPFWRGVHPTVSATLIFCEQIAKPSWQDVGETTLFWSEIPLWHSFRRPRPPSRTECNHCLTGSKELRNT